MYLFIWMENSDQWYGFKTENISIFRYFFINIKFVDEIPFIEIKIPFIEFLEFEL